MRNEKDLIAIYNSNSDSYLVGTPEDLASVIGANLLEMGDLIFNEGSFNGWELSLELPKEFTESTRHPETKTDTNPFSDENLISLHNDYYGVVTGTLEQVSNITGLSKAKVLDIFNGADEVDEDWLPENIDPDHINKKVDRWTIFL